MERKRERELARGNERLFLPLHTYNDHHYLSHYCIYLGGGDKNSTIVFPACRKRRLKGTEREGWGISSSVFYPQEEMRRTGGRECCAS